MLRVDGDELDIDYGDLAIERSACIEAKLGWNKNLPLGSLFHVRDRFTHAGYQGGEGKHFWHRLAVLIGIAEFLAVDQGAAIDQGDPVLFRGLFAASILEHSVLDS